MEIDENINNERLQRAIKCLQLIQRTNPQKSLVAKAATTALKPLLAEAENRPLPPTRTRKAKPVIVQRVEPLQPRLTGDILRGGSPQIDPKTGNYVDAPEGLKVGDAE